MSSIEDAEPGDFKVDSSIAWAEVTGSGQEGATKMFLCTKGGPSREDLRNTALNPFQLFCSPGDTTWYPFH